MSALAKRDTDVAHQKMREMEREIDDQLSECHFNAECRLAIRDAIRLGTGVLKGPNVVKRVQRIWERKQDGSGSVHILKNEEVLEPESRRISPWDVFPDPGCGEDIRKAAYVWERDSILPRDLRGLIGIPGYLEDQIFKVLEEEPKRTSTGFDKKERFKKQTTTVSRGSTYERWEYHGDVDREDLEALGCDCEHDKSKSLSACVVFVNDRPIKVVLNTLDTGDLPYDFFPWTQVADSPFGIGVVRTGIWVQRVLTAAWRQMMDNSGDSSGVNVAINRGLEPADGKWEVTGKKLWIADEDIDDVRKAFVQFQVANNQEHLQAIIDLCLRFMDLVTGLPMLFQGEKAEAPDTLGATNIMVDSSNVALRSRVKLWNDRITVPHLSRYYNWNMQYNENEDIKGDYNVKPSGVSALMERDQRAQTLSQIMKLKADPDFARAIDWEKAFAQLLQSLKLDIGKSDDEMKRMKSEKQQPKQDPRIAGQLQVAKLKVDGDMAKEQLRQKSDMTEIQAKAQEAERERQHEAAMKNADLQIKMMEYAEKRNINLDNIKSDLSKEAAKINLQRELSGPDKEGPQVATPPVEPEGRARDDRAYQE